MTYGRSIEHALDDFHIDRCDWPRLAADRAVWRETLRLGHPTGARRAGSARRRLADTTFGASAASASCGAGAAIDANCNIDATLRALRMPLPQ